jgi:hypothetical protein
MAAIKAVLALAAAACAFQKPVTTSKIRAAPLAAAPDGKQRVVRLPGDFKFFLPRPHAPPPRIH